MNASPIVNGAGRMTGPAFCDDCGGPIGSKRKRAIETFSLAHRCFACQLDRDRKERVRPENVAGIAIGSDYDTTREHWQERQGIAAQVEELQTILTRWTH